MFSTTLLNFSFCTLAFSQITCESKVFRLLVNFYSAIKVAANFTHFLRLLGIIPSWQRRKHGTCPSYNDGKRERTDWLGKWTKAFHCELGLREKLNTAALTSIFGESAQGLRRSGNLHVHFGFPGKPLTRLPPPENVCLHLAERQEWAEQSGLNWMLPTFGHWNMTSAIEVEMQLHLAQKRRRACNKLIQGYGRKCW